ncbi:MAG: hypothetical protein FWC96_01000 [Oscillospiraceae bacterium]|nr:hypothetical protein [Oscillospiraceae bacterium]
MSNAIYYVEYKLKKSASVQDFLQASENLLNGHISKQQGYVSWRQVHDEKNDIWADFCTFETMEDLKTFEANSANPGKLALNFYSFINLNSCKQHYFIIERSYE